MTDHGNGRRPSVCFVSIHNYPALDPSCTIKHIGGAETEKAVLARALVRRGTAVSFVTLDYGQPDGIDLDGIRVFKAYAAEDGWPVVRFVHPRWTGLVGAMKRADADVYVQVNAGCETGQTALWCRRRDKPFVFAVEADTNCTRADWRDNQHRERLLYHHGLRNADHIVAQTRRQQQLLRREFSLESTLIRCCCDDPLENGQWVHRTRGAPRLIWLGRITEQKGLDHLLDIAEACPNVSIDMVGAANVDSPYAERILKRASGIANIQLCGHVPHHDVGRYYDEASALISTSEWEGYPTVFMEAWSRGLPVFSRWDTDDVIAENGLGFVESDSATLAVRLRELLASSQWLSECAARCRSFFEDNHTPSATAAGYEIMFRQLCGS